MSEQREESGAAPAADAAPRAEAAVETAVSSPGPPAAPETPAAAPTAAEPPPAPAEAPVTEETAEPPQALITGEAEAKPSDKPAEAPKPVDQALAEGAVEAPYEWQPFYLPEGIDAKALKEESVAALKALAATKDLSPQDWAQKALDLHIAEMRAYDETVLQRQLKVWEETQVGWRNDFGGDPEIGGSGAATSMRLANMAINRFFKRDQRFGRPLPAGSVTPNIPDAKWLVENAASSDSDHSAFVRMLTVTGAKNHREMVRFLARMESYLQEPARAAEAVGPSAVPRDIANRRPYTAGSENKPGTNTRGRMRDMYDNPRSQEVFNGSNR